MRGRPGNGPVYRDNVVAMELNIEDVCKEVEASLSDRDMQIVRRHHYAPGNGASYFIDGAACVSSVAFWPNGCCDVDYLYVSEEQAEFCHYEFESEVAAVETIVKEIKAAVGRAHTEE